ncbi:MAG: 30S ribosomal protein S8 [Parvularculales bacterium]
MTMSDPLGDMITRIRNSLMRGKSSVITPASKLRGHVLDVLREEGYIRGYRDGGHEGGVDIFVIELKYYEDLPAIKEIKRISKPGRRVYSSVQDMPVVHNGLGISILSTPKGVMSDNNARRNSVGGEVLCQVF